MPEMMDIQLCTAGRRNGASKCYTYCLSLQIMTDEHTSQKNDKSA